jgi:hypothetical protein
MSQEEERFNGPECGTGRNALPRAAEKISIVQSGWITIRSHRFLFTKFFGGPSSQIRK